MKNFLYIFLVFSVIVGSCPLVFGYAIGASNSRILAFTFVLEKTSQIDYEFSINTISKSDHPNDEHFSFYSSFDGCYISHPPESGKSGTVIWRPGRHDIEIWGYNNWSWWGADMNLTYTITKVCPDTDQCVSSTCTFCSTRYCGVHESHQTRIVAHNFNTIPGTEAMEHSHCSNSGSLLDQWQQLASPRWCTECGMMFCPLCPHLCGDYQCPNTPSCDKHTCPVCNGEYCSVHSFHLCSNFHSAGLSAMSNLISMQTSVAGQAIVNVQIQPGPGLDFSELASAMASVEGAINSSSSSIVSQLGSLSGSIEGLNSGISSISNSVTNLNSTVSSSSAGIKEAINTQGGLIVQANNETKSEVTTQGEALLSSSSEIRDAILALEDRIDYNSTVVSENITTELSTNHESDQVVQDSIESEQKETNSFLDQILGLLEGEDTSSGDPGDPEDPGSGGGDITLPEIIDYQDINESAQPYQFDINIVALQTIKDKLLISSSLKNFGGSSSISFNIPLLNETYSIDFLSNETSTIRSFVRAACAFGYCLSFLFACVNTIKSF